MLVVGLVKKYYSTKYTWVGTIFYVSKEEITKEAVGRVIELDAKESGRDEKDRLHFLANELKNGRGWVHKDQTTLWLAKPDEIPS